MDDEDFIRELVTEILNHLGHEVTTAADGAEAIELYKKASASSRPFDVVITDLTIPGGMGGKETIQALVEIDPEVKAIVSSGYSNDPIMSDFKRYGFKNVITKPYRIDELNEVLQEVLRNTSE
jgi:two-component system cell cycle sensor histidine kinase/response regulator CckA